MCCCRPSHARAAAGSARLGHGLPAPWSSLQPTFQLLAALQEARQGKTQLSAAQLPSGCRPNACSLHGSSLPPASRCTFSHSTCSVVAASGGQEGPLPPLDASLALSWLPEASSMLAMPQPPCKPQQASQQAGGGGGGCTAAAHPPAAPWAAAPALVATQPPELALQLLPGFHLWLSMNRPPLQLVGAT